MWKNLWILSLLATIIGCSSIPQSLKQVRAGMDKGEVLQLVGNPKFTFRENSQDHWAYFYESNGQELRRDIVFENGKVIRVTKPTTKEQWQKSLEGADSMEEFESITRQHQKNKEKFQDIGAP